MVQTRLSNLSSNPSGTTRSWYVPTALQAANSHDFFLQELIDTFRQGPENIVSPHTRHCCLITHYIIRI